MVKKRAPAVFLGQGQYVSTMVLWQIQTATGYNVPLYWNNIMSLMWKGCDMQCRFHIEYSSWHRTKYSASRGDLRPLACSSYGWRSERTLLNLVFYGDQRALGRGTDLLGLLPRLTLFWVFWQMQKETLGRWQKKQNKTEVKALGNRA